MPACSEARVGNVYVVGEGNRNHPLLIGRMAVRCALAIARERPDFVISTGAAAGCLACAFGKLSGARVLWLDSIANTERLSLSARIVRRFADVCLTQWPNVAAKYGVEHAGAVL